MAVCSRDQHPAEAAPVVVFLFVDQPGQRRANTFRGAYCRKHGRILLGVMYKCAIDLAAELGEPEFCFGCGNPTDAFPFGLSYFERDFGVKFQAVLCEECSQGAPSSLGEALSGAQRLPPRENSTNRASRR